MTFEKLREQLIDIMDNASKSGMHIYEIYGVISQLEAETWYTMMGWIRESRMKKEERK